MIRRLAFFFFLLPALAVHAQNPSFTSLTSSKSPSIFGQPVTLTATVAPGIGIGFAKTQAAPAANPTGTVTFKNGKTKLGVVTLDANSTATLVVATLPVGQQLILDAIYISDNGFSGSASSILQTVNPAPTSITWVPKPAIIRLGAPLTGAQLDATASTQFTPNVPGTFIYKPPLGTFFDVAGPQILTVGFAPAAPNDFLASQANVQISVVAFNLTSINPATATLGDPAKNVTFTGTGFTRTSVAQVNGNAIPTSFVNATTLTGTIPSIAFSTASTLQLTVTDPQIQGATNALPLPVTVPPLQIVLTGPPTTPSATQPSLDFRLTKPYPVPITGTFTLTFTPAAGLPDDPMIQFAGGGRTFTFTILPNAVAPIVQFQAGTVTGTVTITLTVRAGGVDVTPDGLPPVIIQVPPAPPALTSATMLQRNGKQLTVVIHGYSNTRELTTANFDFTAASGTIKNPNVTVPVTTLFTQWYASQPSDQFGSAFTYTQSFTLNDDASHIRSVSVTLVNSIGTSTPGSAQ